ncbi:MAG: hypothetical protein KDC53_19560 [Saprospiraceae bacterium]|nr:hypothetical protein [Saprospiraceae bacterium]
MNKNLIKGHILSVPVEAGINKVPVQLVMSEVFQFGDQEKPKGQIFPLKL